MIFNPKNIEELGRKERERLFKQNEILFAASNVFAEKGYENTTIEDIAESAEFGKGTLYNYFQSKEEIYNAIVEGILSNYLELIKETDSTSKSLQEFLTVLTKKVFQFYVNNRYAFTILIRTRIQDLGMELTTTSEIMKQKHKQVIEICLKRINEAIKKNEIRNLDPESLVTLYGSMVLPFIHNRMFCGENEKFDIETDSELIISVLFKGILKK